MILLRRYTVTLTILIFCSPIFAQAKYEMRGVWVATVANIDWPTNPLLTSKTQKEQIKEILDSCQALKLNAVFLQIRACADAFYQSKTEPWSKYLTGTQDQRPSPYYDPLQTWVEESHKRGIELHAWLNPFRISNDTIETLSRRNIAMRHPEWVVTYGGKRYLNPGEPSVIEYIKEVVSEIITKYPVDGIHLDDYFYPYPVRGQQFNDSTAFQNYGFNYQSINDWRRNNVDNVVETISKTIKESNKGIKFGISPFGIWRNGFTDQQGSDTEGGITNYDDLYADVIGWLKNGWLDYYAPQLYWNFSHDKASYTTLLNWWSTNSYNTPLFIGESLYKINARDKNWTSKTEMENHILTCRQTENCNGNIYFSYNHFQRNLNNLQVNLKKNIYKYPALAPYFNKEDKPNTSTIEIRKRKKKILVKSLDRDRDEGSLIRYGLYRFDTNERAGYPMSKNMVSISYTPEISIVKGNLKKKIKQKYALTYIAPDGQESELSNTIIIKSR